MSLGRGDTADRDRRGRERVRHHQRVRLEYFHMLLCELRIYFD